MSARRGAALAERAGGAAPARQSAPPRSISGKETTQAQSPVEAAFRAGLMAPDLPVPAGLVDGAGRPAGRRYFVYRNNVAVALREALETGFPAVRALLGPQRFAHVAGLYLRQAPPETPVMMRYGAGFAAFLAGVPQLRGLGYLPDVARLEYALRDSYHAADSAALPLGEIEALSGAALMAARVTLAPSLRLLPSVWPQLSIRARALDDAAPAPPAVAEDVLILRPEFDPEAHLLPDGGARFVAALAAGRTLGAALDHAGEDFDLAAVLPLLLQGGAIVALTPEKESPDDPRDRAV